VKRKKASPLKVKLMDSTVYSSGNNNQDKPAKLTDLATGDFVVIHATRKTPVSKPDRCGSHVRSRPSARSRRAEAEILKKSALRKFLLVHHMAGMRL